MVTLRLIFRLILFVLFIASYLAVGLALLAIKNQKKRRQWMMANAQKHTKICLYFLGLKVTVKNLDQALTQGPYLLVSNHLGMLDILLIQSVVRTLFITSVEMRDTPVLGTLCDAGGCLYVERRSRSNIRGEIGQIRDALIEGHNVVVFPEATSTNGEKILPFKKSLLVAAADTPARLLPLVINFRQVNGEPMSAKYRDTVCWYGDQSFASALFRILSARSIEAEIEFLQPIRVENEEQRREVAGIAQAMIEAKYAPIVSSMKTGA